MATVPTFGDKLKAAREKASLTQYALAKRAGLSKQAVSRLEDGKRNPTWDTVQLLALALGVDCRAFMNPSLALPVLSPPRPSGRPRKEPKGG